MSQLPAFLDKCREAGWRVLGADAGRDAVPAGDVVGLPGSPAVLVLVSREVCDALWLASLTRAVRVVAVHRATKAQVCARW